MGSWFIFIRSIEQSSVSWCSQGVGDGIDLQCFERDSTKHCVEIGSKQGIEDGVPTGVIIGPAARVSPGCSSVTIPRSSSRVPTS